MILADKIIMLRKKCGWSQEELAERLDVSRQSVSKWEGAQSAPDLDRVLKLSRVFGVSTDFLLKDEMEIPEYSQAQEDDSARVVTMEEANDFLANRKQAADEISSAILLLILSPVILLLLTGAAEVFGRLEKAAWGVGMLVLMSMTAVAVQMLVSSGMKGKKFEYLKRDAVRMEYGVNGMVRERQEKFRRRYEEANQSGVFLGVFSAAPLVLAICFTRNALVLMIAIALMLAILAIAVQMLVDAHVRWAGYEALTKI